MTRAILPALLLLAAPAAAWDLEEGAGIAERARDLQQLWRPYNGTMVDRDMVKRSSQEREPDWVTREKGKITPPERPFGRVHGFTLRRDDVRFVMMGRYGPLPVKPKVKELVYALRMAEGAGVAELWKALSRTEGEKLELSSSAPGRDAFSSPASLRDVETLKLVWHPLDFYRDPGKNAEFYVLFYADKPRGPIAPAGGPKKEGGKNDIRFLKAR